MKMKKYEVTLNMCVNMVVTVDALTPEAAVQRALFNAEHGVELSYDSTLIDDVSMPIFINTMTESI